MIRQVCNSVSARTVPVGMAISAICALAMVSPGRASQANALTEQSSAAEDSEAAAVPRHMSEELRSSIDKLVIIAGPVPANQDVTGSYEKQTPGLVGGMDAGSRATTISKDIGGVPMNIPIPILTFPATILGGISGATMREIQEFRDALTEDLAQAANQPLTNDGLASDVYFGLQRVSGMESRLFAPTTPVPEDTDAIMYVSVNELTIDVDGKDAILTTTAGATLHRLHDNRNLYETTIKYQDRDTLANWTKNDNALWRDYANFARHYLGREISADVFDRVELEHELRPKESDTITRVKKNDWQGVSKSTTPTFAWELKLPGDDSYDAWAKEIDESNTFYDVEIYDLHQLVYAETQVPDPFHTLAYPIEVCGTYRWSVRPSYHVDGGVKFGEWMRFDSGSDNEDDAGKGIVGSKASVAPAYIQDFAVLEIKCGRK